MLITGPCSSGLYSGFEHGVEHVRREAAGLRVEAAGVVAVDDCGAGVEAVDGGVGEGVFGELGAAGLER